MIAGRRGDAGNGGVYPVLVRVLALALIGTGLAVLVRTVEQGGGPLSLGVVMGATLIAVGAFRLALASGRAPGDGRSGDRDGPGPGAGDGA